MQSSPQSASVPVQAPSGETERSVPNDDLIYQVMTVAAILLVLASLLGF
jgi:hypothetical protein